MNWIYNVLDKVHLGQAVFEESEAQLSLLIFRRATGITQWYYDNSRINRAEINLFFLFFWFAFGGGFMCGDGSSCITLVYANLNILMPIVYHKAWSCWELGNI